MINPDQRLENLKQIIKRFKAFCEKNGKVTEADTRAQIIDEILKKVLGWDDHNINREKHSPETGFMDYELSAMGKKMVVIEAKKEGIPFVFPESNEYQALKLNGTLVSDAEIKEAIYQVRSYCDNEGMQLLQTATHGLFLGQ